MTTLNSKRLSQAIPCYFTEFEDGHKKHFKTAKNVSSLETKPFDAYAFEEKIDTDNAFTQSTDNDLHSTPSQCFDLQSPFILDAMPSFADALSDGHINLRDYNVKGFNEEYLTSQFTDDNSHENEKSILFAKNYYDFEYNQQVNSPDVFFATNQYHMKLLQMAPETSNALFSTQSCSSSSSNVFDLYFETEQLDHVSDVYLHTLESHNEDNQSKTTTDEEHGSPISETPITSTSASASCKRLRVERNCVPTLTNAITSIVTENKRIHKFIDICKKSGKVTKEEIILYLKKKFSGCRNYSQLSEAIFEKEGAEKYITPNTPKDLVCKIAVRKIIDEFFEDHYDWWIKYEYKPGVRLAKGQKKQSNDREIEEKRQVYLEKKSELKQRFQNPSKFARKNC